MVVGFFIWCWNDEELLDKCLSTFRDTTDVYLVGILNASTDGSSKLVEKYCNEIWTFQDPQSIAKCVNLGYTTLHEYSCEYMGWIHPDQVFNQKGWVDTLKTTLDTYPQIGKISCWNTKYGHPSEQMIYPGAEAGNLIRRKEWIEIGPYDESYIGCGGYEDWDIQKRFIEKGLANCITTEAKMWHTHVGTREKIDWSLRHQQWLHNQQVYYENWHTYDYAMAPDGFERIYLAR